MIKSIYATECSTKASRKALADKLTVLGNEAGWEVTCEFDDPREIYISMQRGLRRVSMDLEGHSRVGAYIASWHTQGFTKGIAYPKDFPSSSVNTYHFGKATTIEYSFSSLWVALSKCFTYLKTLEDCNPDQIDTLSIDPIFANMCMREDKQ